MMCMEGLCGTSNLANPNVETKAIPKYSNRFSNVDLSHLLLSLSKMGTDTISSSEILSFGASVINRKSAACLLIARAGWPPSNRL